MADEQHRWLDRGTAERLLNGEPPEAADPATRDQAERLAGTLRALSAPPPSADGELPGEAAALAAFRAHRRERREPAHPDTTDGAAGSDVALVRLGAPHGDGSGTPGGRRPPRSLRLGLAAALVAGTVGGAAVLAGAGILPTPSGGTGGDPAASTSAPHPEQPLLSPPPHAGRATPGGRQPQGPSGPGEDGAGVRPDADTGTGGPLTPGQPGPDSGDPAARSGRGGKQLLAACRAWRDGKHLNGERRRLLEDEAGGPARVGGYCRATLADGNGNGNGNGNGAGSGTGSSVREGTGDTREAEAGTDGRGQGNKNDGGSTDNGKNNGGSTDNGKNTGGNQGKSDKKGQGASQGKGSGKAQGNGS
ncbi:hypothetical protein GCM10010261_26120 [Streptomyces pilosus]|uniref:hypothetical protein n=1 Tax=Streptomyces pilosus TaxID=28893 RepID=UPI00167A0FFC|nr:hypothetical protein [Streptomyces pilosus]GGV49008.1 hypothetical protein GCM10010261_26120 [Streptomyces pilosus]